MGTGTAFSQECQARIQQQQREKTMYGTATATRSDTKNHHVNPNVRAKRKLHHNINRSIQEYGPHPPGASGDVAAASTNNTSSGIAFGIQTHPT